MKKLLLFVLVGVLFLGGCSTKSVEERMDSMGNKVEDGLNKIMDTTAGQAKDISRQDAVDIALRHAGTTESQVTGLHTEYEIDDGVGHYDVRFLLNGREYDYEISASSGKVLSFEVDE